MRGHDPGTMDCDTQLSDHPSQIGPTIGSDWYQIAKNPGLFKINFLFILARDGFSPFDVNLAYLRLRVTGKCVQCSRRGLFTFVYRTLCVMSQCAASHVHVCHIIVHIYVTQ